MPVLSESLRREKIETLMKKGRYREAITVLSSVADESGLSPRDRINVLYNLAYCHQATGDYSKALDNLADIVGMEVADSLEYEKADSYFLLARIYRLAGEFQKSDSIFAEVERVMARSGRKDTSLSARLHLEKSSACLDADRHKEAFAELKKASSFRTSTETRLLIDMGMAELYGRMGEPDMAEEYYKSYLAASGPSINRLYALHNYAELLVDLGRYEEASDTCRRLLYLTETGGIRHVNAAAYGVLARALYGAGRYKEAYEAHEKFYKGMDSVLWQEGPDITAEYEKKLAGSVSRESNRDETSYMPVIIAGIAAACGIAAWVFVMKRRKRTRREVADDAGDKYDETETAEERQSFMTTDLSPLHLSLQLAQSNEAMREIARLGCDPTIDGNIRRRKINDIQKSMEVSRNLWDDFMTCFGNMHPSFLRSLYTRHPDLSKGEVRMCAFIVMAISTKEIAAITCRSARTVESMKYRLHKKLGLEPGTTTESYLRSLV